MSHWYVQSKKTNTYLVYADWWMRVIEAKNHSRLLDIIIKDPSPCVSPIKAVRLMAGDKQFGLKHFKSKWFDLKSNEARSFVTQATGNATELAVRWEFSRWTFKGAE